MSVVMPISRMGGNMLEYIFLHIIFKKRKKIGPFWWQKYSNG